MPRPGPPARYTHYSSGEPLEEEWEPGVRDRPFGHHSPPQTFLTDTRMGGFGQPFDRDRHPSWTADEWAGLAGIQQYLDTMRQFMQQAHPYQGYGDDPANYYANISEEDEGLGDDGDEEYHDNQDANFNYYNDNDDRGLRDSPDELGNDGHEAAFERDPDPWETSSTESRSLVLPHNYWSAANRLSGVCYKPVEVRTFMGHMTMPHLKALCSLWHLPKTGTKAVLLERLYNHLMSASDSPVGGSAVESNRDQLAPGDGTCPKKEGSSSGAKSSSLPSPSSTIPCKRSSPRKSGPPPPTTRSYAALLAELNDEYARYNSTGWRPFQMPPIAISGEYLCLLEDFEWDYVLPYPWILERKLSPPVMVSLLHEISAHANGGGSVNIEVNRPMHAGARLLLVAIKYRTEGANRVVEMAPRQEHDNKHGQEDLGVPGSSSGTKGNYPTNFASDHVNISWPPKEYRHAYIKDFQCTFDGLHYGGGRYETSTVHQVTSYLTGSSASGKMKEPIALWTLRLDLLPTRMTSHLTSSKRQKRAIGEESERPDQEGYFLQIVSARRDPNEWLHSHQRTIKTKPAAQAMAQIRRDFQSPANNGISTSAIRISLRCPLSLQRMVTPVRSRRCRHPQCWELDSSLTGLLGKDPYSHSTYEQESPVYRCPVCDVTVTPDALFVDGLVKEMLSQCPQEDEVLIDTETGVWRPISDANRERERISTAPSPPGSRKALGKSTPSIVDLTVTPDEPIDPTQVAAVYFKADPGATERVGRTFSTDSEGWQRNVLVNDLAAVPPVARKDSQSLSNQHMVMLDEADVVQSEAWYLDSAPAGVSEHRPPHHNRGGTSAFDAIIID